MNRLASSIAFVVSLASVAGAQAQQQVVNVYTARHYQTDEAMYANFTTQTGIKINRLGQGSWR